MESGITAIQGANIILVGGREVGKTTIFNRVSIAQFPVSYVPTVGRHKQSMCRLR